MCSDDDEEEEDFSEDNNNNKTKDNKYNNHANNKDDDNENNNSDWKGSGESSLDINMPRIRRILMLLYKNHDAYDENQSGIVMFLISFWVKTTEPFPER